MSQKTRLATLCGAVAGLLALSSISFGQAPAAGQQGQRGQGRQGRQGGRGAQSLGAIPVAMLDEALKLTADQKTKVTAIHDKYVAETKDLRPKPGEQADPANATKIRDLGRTATTDIQALLTDEQKEKLKELRLVLTGFSTAGIPLDIVGDLKLTAEQKTKLAAIAKDVADKTKDFTPEDRRTKGREINQAARTQAEALLTAEQKTAIEKYNKEHPRPGRRQQPNR
jgi:hypothetical protein